MPRLPAKTGRALSTREAEALRGALDEPWTGLVALLAYTGMRPGGALALRWGRPAKTALVLAHPSGCGWTKTAWGNWRRRDFGEAREAAGIGELRPYDLRHTFASLLLAEGRFVHYVAEQLGHSAVMTLRTYGHVIADYRDRQTIDAEPEIRAARGRTADVVGPAAAQEAS